MKSTVAKSVLLSTVIFLAVAFAGAQSKSGEIRGRVTDPNGAVVPGAKVRFSPVGNGTIGENRSTTTNSEGEYSIQGLSLGRYEVTVTLSGFSRPFTERVEITEKKSLKNDVTFSFAACSDEPKTKDDSRLTEADHAEIVRAVIGRMLGDSPKPNEKKAIFSSDSLTANWLTPEQNARISIIHLGKIIEMTEETGGFYYFSLSKPKRRINCVAISLINNLTVKGQLENANMAGGADHYEVRKVNGKWIATLLSSEIS